MNIFDSKEQAEKYARSTYGDTQVETQTVNAVKVGPMVAKYLGCSCGWAIDCEMP